jgi:type I restriction enzyme, S subunit
MSEVGYALQPLQVAVAEHIGGGTPSRQVPSYWSGSIPWASVKDFPEHAGVISDTEEHISPAGLTASGSKLIPEGIPLVCTRMAVGRAAMPLVPMAINQDVKALFPAVGVDGEYLLKLLQFMQPQAEARAVGSTVKGIRIQDYLNVAAPVADRNSQPVIAKVLDTLNIAIKETEAIIAKLKAIRQGLLHDLLTRGIDANGELRPPQSEARHLYKESPLGWIPKQWDTKSLSAIAEVKSGATPSREQSSRYFAAIGTPWIKTLDLNEDAIEETDEYITVSALRETSCSLLPEGTVLVAMYGGWEQIGRTALLAVPGATNQAISALIFRYVETVPEFVLRALQHGRPRWKRVAASTRKDPNITKADVLAFEIVWPSVEEQRTIAQRMRSSLTRLHHEAATLEKLRCQRLGLMEDLLTGRVRVIPLLG